MQVCERPPRVIPVVDVRELETEGGRRGPNGVHCTKYGDICEKEPCELGPRSALPQYACACKVENELHAYCVRLGGVVTSSACAW